MSIFATCDICGKGDSCELEDGQYMCEECWWEYVNSEDYDIFEPYDEDDLADYDCFD